MCIINKNKYKNDGGHRHNPQQKQVNMIKKQKVNSIFIGHQLPSIEPTYSLQVSPKEFPHLDKTH